MGLTTNIFGFNFICDMSYDHLAQEIINTVSDPSAGIFNLITPNAHGIRIYQKYPELNTFTKTSQFVLPDGQPIVWLSKLTDHPIKQRLTGSDFFPVMYSHIKNTDHRCLFVLSHAKLQELFNKERSGDSYLVAPFINTDEHTKMEGIADDMAQIIMTKKIKHVFLGISDPKQTYLAFYTNKKLLKLGYTESCVFYLLGASYEFYFGLKKRAPAFFQKNGLEWLYRLMLEPRRMFNRYVIGNFLFLFTAIKWMVNKKSFNVN